MPLTWPLEVHDQMTVNHHRHLPYLRHSQLIYKQGILGYDIVPILRVIIQIAIPSITEPHRDRSSRNEGIIKLMLYTFRNIAAISPLGVLGWTQEDDDAARSATITAFQEQDVFALLLTMCSNVAEEFAFQDTILLEVLFHLLKGVDPASLFTVKKPQEKQRATELTRLLEKEASVNREYAKNAPTRHGRFGTMIWVKRDADKMSTMSGQTMLKDDGAALLQKMDELKKWTRPTRKKNAEESKPSVYTFANDCKLSPAAAAFLSGFVGEFLDSGFNPLFIQIRKSMDREAERVTETTPLQFFYLVSWFLRADRLRRRVQHLEAKEKRRQLGPNAEVAGETDGFGLVAGVLSQEMFIALNRAMQKALDDKHWRTVNATMRCFTQILLTVQDMMASHVEEDRDIADNILQRIFYEETTHDRIVALLRGYKDQGFNYLDACTELSYIFLRMLEQYSKSNVNLQIRSRRKGQRKKKTRQSRRQGESQASLGEENDEEMDGGDGGGGGDEEEEELNEQHAQSLAAERTFDFKRLSQKFCCQNSVNTFVAFMSHYRELSPEQLKRAHRLFHRVAFKEDMSVLLYRVDIIALFYRIIKGPQSLETRNPMYVEWEGLVRLVLRNMIRRLRESPELLVEMLFSKIRSTQFYLEYGYERPVLHKKKKRRDGSSQNDTAVTNNNTSQNQGEEPLGHLVDDDTDEDENHENHHNRRSQGHGPDVGEEGQHLHEDNHSDDDDDDDGDTGLATARTNREKFAIMHDEDDSDGDDNLDAELERIRREWRQTGPDDQNESNNVNDDAVGRGEDQDGDADMSAPTATETATATAENEQERVHSLDRANEDDSTDTERQTKKRRTEGPEEDFDMNKEEHTNQ